uniref:Putative secreted protein n=1 Tax=Rhipicephalus microplus TaxID=6941 RepID=A0A6M2DBM0_RHIMP
MLALYYNCLLFHTVFSAESGVVLRACRQMSSYCCRLLFEILSIFFFLPVPPNNACLFCELSFTNKPRKTHSHPTGLSNES